MVQHTRSDILTDNRNAKTGFIWRMRGSIVNKLRHFFAKAAAAQGIVLLSTALIVQGVYANPVLDNVAAGNVSVQQTATTTTVNQASQQAILNWRSFNIGAQEATHFAQPTGGIALNRINPTQGASQIYGMLTATGRIILVNPAGIYFGPGSYVNVGGMIATTSNISDQNFLKGNLLFDQASPYAGASIINAGTIIAAQHGLIALVGQNVSNSGTIQANLGRVTLATGDVYTVDLSGNQLINFAVGHTTSRSGSVTNTGKLIANGGTIAVSAEQSSGVLDNVINMGGEAIAHSVHQHNGEIILSGDQNGGVVHVTGKLIASGKHKHQTGGTVDVTGYDILLDSNSLIDVSGDAGGGNVNVGGNMHGAGPLPNANALIMEPGATINANAITNGNGGQVVLWSNNYTNTTGNISAMGGSQSGNGGFIETSSKNYLDVNGISVNTSAVAGDTGTWLLDPTNIYIATNQASATAGNAGAGIPGMTGTDTSINTSTPPNFLASGAVQDSLLLISTLTSGTGLGGASNVSISTTNGSGTGAGNIYLLNTLTWATARTLTLTAANNIVLGAAVTTGAAGSALILNAVGSVTQTAGINGSGSVTKQGAGTFTASQTNGYTGGTTISAGIFDAQNSSAIGTGSISVTSGAALQLDGSGISINIPITLMTVSLAPPMVSARPVPVMPPPRVS